VSELLEEICAAFGLGHPVGDLTPIDGGLTHRMSRLTTNRGVYAVKEISLDPGNTWEAKRIERAFLLEQAAFEGGLPLPRPIPVRTTSGCLTEVAHSDGSQAVVRVHEWVEGEGLRRLVYGTDFAARVGATLAAIHALKVSASETLGDSLRVRGGEYWLALAERVEQSSIEWRWEFRGLLPTIQELETYVTSARDDSTPLILSHRDADQKNWMKTATGELLLVDWDAAGPVHPRHDVASTALAWAGVHLGEPDWKVVRAWVSGFRQAGGRLDPFRPGDLAEFVAVAVGWFEYNVRRALGEQSRAQADREFGADTAYRDFKGLPRILRRLEPWERILREE
jgi:aminoglycoside phosphotransferase (APT) family kinase protein